VLRSVILITVATRSNHPNDDGHQQSPKCAGEKERFTPFAKNRDCEPYQQIQPKQRYEEDANQRERLARFVANVDHGRLWSHRDHNKHACDDCAGNQVHWTGNRNSENL